MSETKLAARERQAREHLYGCTVELDPGEEPDSCVLDYGAPSDCTHAKNRRVKWTCPYWRLKSAYDAEVDDALSRTKEG